MVKIERHNSILSVHIGLRIRIELANDLRPVWLQSNHPLHYRRLNHPHINYFPDLREQTCTKDSIKAI